MRARQPPTTRARPGRLGFAVLLFCLGGPLAHAHLVTTGLGPVYDGVAHLALSPADVALVVAVALLAAMRGARHGRWLLAVLPTTWLAGAVVGLFLPVEAGMGWATGLAFLLTGALVAADRDLPVLVVSALVGIMGSFHGFLTGAALAATPSAGLELTGEWVALIVIVTLVAGVVVSLRAFWARIVVRVVGSWIAATGLLVIGWSLRMS